ncbi:MAG: Asp23/Gls24 family envelope stress response protein [Clostridia bacterium]|nr:Asp23/Gls24 family envelope stress response protein [Clostridia bacterium]
MSNNILRKDTEIATGTTLDKNILLSIISLATKEISGVARMDNRLRSRMKDKFCSNYFEGAKVSYNKKKKLEIDVYVVVYQNYNVAEISYKIQQNIKSSLQTMVEDVGDVNVHVVGVVNEDDFIEQ